ncbi:surfeit locus protein 1 isoform X2 [Odontomachus brunneus]|uniref:surfeit locus protein 1 isoform X2 n=2 Tax=Odontomachus brunneus TaxID=486640 RepID=UPI0013F18B31|nr:surfeit locus protein 1 isoform X2 [Odontomachus brunneus]
MNLTIKRMLESLKNTRCILNKSTRVLMFGNINTQARYKSITTKPNVIIQNQYQRKDVNVGLYGYSLLAIPIVAFGLGTWQIKRWRWKLNLIDNLEQRTTAEPIDLPLNLYELEDKEYYRVKIKGKFIYDKEFLIGPRSLIIKGQGLSEKGGGVFSSKSNTGYYVVTPFKLEDRDMTIMVNRGWIPKNARFTYKQEDKITNSMEIVGIVRTTEKRPPFVPLNSPMSGIWHYRDLKEMAKVAEAEPVYIELSVGYGTPKGPIGGQTKIVLRNEHLSYIVTCLRYFLKYKLHHSLNKSFYRITFTKRVKK